MFKFLNIKAHRKSFIHYISVLLLICLTISGLIFVRMIHIYADEHQAISELSLKRSENNVNTSITKIEAFIAKIYTDEKLLEDFVRFFGNDAEEYLSSRLSQIEIEKQNVSFIKESRKFISEMDRVIKQIVFFSGDKANTITLSDNGSVTLDFLIPFTQTDLPQNDISFGYIYKKSLPFPNSISFEMGKIYFVIDAEKLILQAKENQMENVYVLSPDGSIKIADTLQLSTSTILKTILNTKRTEGSFKYNLFNSYYYINQTSEQYGYQFISYIDTASIIHKNRNAFFLLCSISLAIFIVAAVLITIKIRHDADFLNDIITSISEAKNGQFNQTKFRTRNDEYGIIATELNDMSLQINRFIEKEYILKIEQQKAEMKALQNQINPHFLYNTLEIIRSRALVNNDKDVSNAISYLGSLYRNIVKAHNELTIKQEIEILSEYLKLMEFRYSSNFYYEIDFDKGTLQSSTIKLWMQPIVENFFTHGFDSNNDYNLMLVLGQEYADYYEIKFVDNGKKIEDSNLTGINQMFLNDLISDLAEPSGLVNVYQRLTTFYSGKIKMWIENNETAGVSVVVRIDK